MPWYSWQEPSFVDGFVFARVLLSVGDHLDRLSRDAAFLMSLRDAGIEFVATDMPTANRLTVGLMGLIAEHEGVAISARVKAALAAAKARGTQLGAYRDGVFVGRTGTADDALYARTARSAKAQSTARCVRFVVDRIDPDGSLSLRELAQKLNEERVPTASGKGQWAAMTVKRLRERPQGAA
jgi:DNA invertase Pin-like site-specific DNA recombinase